ncbi:TonB-dependent receptor [Prosthecochloris sp. DSM 1685]|nr:TonB-dependent receptor [Prosthecochloris ethylica]NUK48480.1 TonB-dependent receptor [Prosthecochloris ethylica]
MDFGKKMVFAFCVGSACSIVPATSWCSEDEASVTMEMPEMTVTANKIEEDVQDVPQSITVVGEDILEEKGIEGVPDLIREIPNAFYSPGHGNSVNFRGLNTSMFTSNNPVVIYIDGVPYSRAYGFDASLVNAERIEVLRGPQGSLYGKDAIGGVINIVSKEPTNEFHGKVGAEYGSFDYKQGLLNLNGPVVKDKLYFGINGWYEQDDGWIENTYPGMEVDANRQRNHNYGAFLLFKPTERFNVRLNISNLYNKLYLEDGYALPGGSVAGDFSRDDAEKVSYDTETYSEIESNAQSLHLSYDFDALTVTSVTTHRTLTTEGDWDADFGDDPLWAGLVMFDDAETDTWTEELRFSSNNPEGFRWVGGVYLDTEEHETGPYGMQMPFNPFTYALEDWEYNAESISDSKTYAIFGQVMIPLVTNLELTLGARYQHIEKEIDLDMYVLPVGTSGSPAFHLESEKTWDVFLPKAALSFGITDDWKTYFSFSKGYMPGGFNYFSSSGTAEDNSFEPQKSTNYELGIKGSYKRLNLSASAFYMGIEDIHVYRSPGGGIYYTGNADKAHSRGAELEVTYFPTDSIELSGALGVIEAEYDDYDDGAGNVFDGEKIPQTPSHTARLGIAYYHPNGFYTRTDLYNQGAVYFYNDANKSFDREGGHTLLDMKVGYRSGGMDVYAYGKNLTDEEYVDGLRANSSAAVATFGDPRTFGVGAQYRF